MTDIEVRSVSRWYGERLAVDDVSFTVRAGTTTCLLGPNGSGKSSLLRRVLGIDDGAGTALFSGVPYRRLPTPLTTVGVVLDTSGIHPGIRARQHLSAIARAWRLPSRRVDEVLATVGLSAAADVRSRALSLGMRQRLAFATALLGSPQVLVLDEPTNGLDPHGVQWLNGCLRDFTDDGGTVLMSSHLIGGVAQVADRVEVMVAGRLIASGTPQEVAQSRAPHAVVVRTTCPAQLRDHLASRGAEVTITGDRLHVIGLDVRQVATIAKAAPGLVLALQVQDASLEQAYLTIAGAP